MSRPPAATLLLLITLALALTATSPAGASNLMSNADGRLAPALDGAFSGELVALRPTA